MGELLIEAQSYSARTLGLVCIMQPNCIVRSVLLGSATVSGIVDRKVILSKDLVLQRGMHARTTKNAQCKCKGQYICFGGWKGRNRTINQRRCCLFRTDSQYERPWRLHLRLKHQYKSFSVVSLETSFWALTFSLHHHAWDKLGFIECAGCWHTVMTVASRAGH